MSKVKNVIGIDLGTDSVKAVAMETVVGETAPRILGTSAAASRGMRKGTVINPEETARSLKEAVESLEKSTDIKSGNFYVGLAGTGLGFQKSKGVIAISRADGEVTKEDVARSAQASEASLLKLQNREILHKIPMNYRVDNEPATHDPVGLSGLKLEAETLFITSLAQNVKSVIRAFEAANLDIAEIFAAPLGLVEATLSEHNKEAGALILDLGASTTSLILFEEGHPHSLEILSLGSANITHDIAIGFKVPIEEAEKIKLNYGAVGNEALNFKKDELVYGNYSKKKLAEIIEARLEDIFELAEKHLKKVERAGLVPAGVFLVGGGANLPGIESFAKDILKFHVCVAEPVNVGGVKEKIKNPAWASAVGTALMALEKESGASPFLRGRGGSVFKWLKAFLP